MPVVIYLHGNSSSRVEGMRIAPELLKRDINLFIFDFAGCGMSEGEFISLGHHERSDVKIVIDFVEKLPGVSRIGLWGRSMGAATASMYTQSDERVKAVVYDSSFCDFSKLAKELSKKQVNLPNFILDTALSFIRKTIQNKNNVDIYQLTPITYAPKTTAPGFFVHAMNDELIPLEHSLSLFEVYGGNRLKNKLTNIILKLGEKSLNICEGGHNTMRQKTILEKISKFFAKWLLDQTDF